MKSYYRTLLGSHGRYFRIRHVKEREVISGGEITMTSYPAGNKTLLSRKPCIADKKVTMQRYQEFMIALSKSVMRKGVQRPLADD